MLHWQGRGGIRHAVRPSTLLTALPVEEFDMTRLLLWCFLLMTPLVAAEPVFTNEEWAKAQGGKTEAAGPAAPPAAPATGPALVSIGVSLVAVLALAVALGWLVKKAGVKRLMPRKGDHLEVLESLPLGFKRQVFLIRVGEQVVLVGNGEHELTALGTFPAAGFALATPPPAPAPVPTPPVDGRFAGLLDQALGRKS